MPHGLYSCDSSNHLRHSSYWQDGTKYIYVDLKFVINESIVCRLAVHTPGSKEKKDIVDIYIYFAYCKEPCFDKNKTTTKSRRKFVHHAQNGRKRNGGHIWCFFLYIFWTSTTPCATHYKRMRAQFSRDSPQHDFRGCANLPFLRLFFLNINNTAALGATRVYFVLKPLLESLYAPSAESWRRKQTPEVAQLAESTILLSFCCHLKRQLCPCTVISRWWSFGTGTITPSPRRLLAFHIPPPLRYFS